MKILSRFLVSVMILIMATICVQVTTARSTKVFNDKSFQTKSANIISTGESKESVPGGASLVAVRDVEQNIFAAELRATRPLDGARLHQLDNKRSTACHIRGEIRLRKPAEKARLYRSYTRLRLMIEQPVAPNLLTAQRE